MHEDALRELDSQMPEWYVTSEADFWTSCRRERPGILLPFTGGFSWAGSRWKVPGVYSCGKALVVDFCREIHGRKAFRPQVPEEKPRVFTKEESIRFRRENPLAFSFHPTAVVNGWEYSFSQGSGTCCVLSRQSVQEAEGYWAARHYGLDISKSWQIWRFSFPWSRRKQVESLALRMEAENAVLPGTPFQIRQGEKVNLKNPFTGETGRLTALECRQAVRTEFPPLEGWEFPPISGNSRIRWSRRWKGLPSSTRKRATRCAGSRGSSIRKGRTAEMRGTDPGPPP